LFGCYKNRRGCNRVWWNEHRIRGCNRVDGEKKEEEEEVSTWKKKNRVKINVI